MPTPEPEDPVERAILDNALEAIREDWGFHERFGLVDLLRDWEKTVTMVARGYDPTFENYGRDLAIRDEIASLVARVPQPFALRLERWIAPLDATFMANTVETAEPVLPPLDREPLASWWYRMTAGVRPIDADVAATWPK